MDKQLDFPKSLDDFKKRYWTVAQLRAFCRQNKLPPCGNKIDINNRIQDFLSTGNYVAPVKITKLCPPDSASGIGIKTPVIHYKNDTKTREFFIRELGPDFSFNHYLRSFSKKIHDGSLCYGDLVIGYKESLSNPAPPIEKQFKFNQFQRDFFNDNPLASRNDCINAWNKVKLVSSEPTYSLYLKLQR